MDENQVSNAGNVQRIEDEAHGPIAAVRREYLYWYATSSGGTMRVRGAEERGFATS